MSSNKSILTPHDRYTRSSFLEPEVAREFFEKYLPLEIKSIIELETLTPQPESVIAEDLHMQVVDILFTVQTKDGPGYIYLLIEHASSPSKMLPLRMSKYVVAIMDRHYQRTKETSLPIVYPLIFYTGKRPFKYSTNFYTLFKELKKLARIIYSNPFRLIDLQKISDEELNAMPWFRVIGLTMKHIKSSNFSSKLKTVIESFRQDERTNGSEYIDRTLLYRVPLEIQFV